jgi:hypothetical protein
MVIKSFYSKILSVYYNLKLGIHAKVKGVQLLPSHLRWLNKFQVNRDHNFKVNGYTKFKLISEQEWGLFSEEVNNFFKNQGEINNSKVDWALNKRIYLNIENTPKINEFIDKLLLSEAFINTVNKTLGSNNWKIYSKLIWRNYPEDFDNGQKEINSSFYHVDNGGEKNNRLLVNIFMYLSPISEYNGPFTFYDKKSSYLINKIFYKYIIKYGNLRKYFLTTKIEEFITPNLLLDSSGDAIIINNQECLHRAGFCTNYHRDILEIIVEPTIIN